ncbi:MAG: aminoacyl-tRNA hydrolase [Coriobacteriia bacterium]|nr:aminoacyl-tRNA hydrolase [Coriobacteriia bacterium]
MNEVNFLVVGLGNPGIEYEATRHNVGFMAIDELGARHGASYWKREAGALTAAVTMDGVPVLLAKPTTFMNLSGISVARLAHAYGVEPTHILVVHDDIDIETGEIRVKDGGGHAGHNGLRSIHAKLGTDEYRRVRIGVGRPLGRMDAASYVLQPLRGETLEGLRVSAAEAADNVESALKTSA